MILEKGLSIVLRSTNYRGHIDITFPVGERAVTIMTPHFINRYRSNIYIWWTCVILQLWIITWPVMWLMTRRWEIATAKWQYRICTMHTPTAEEVAKNGPPTRCTPDGVPVYVIPHTIITEERWIKEWEAAIIRAVEQRVKGQIDDTHVNDARAVDERNAARRRESGASQHEQSGFVGTMTGLMRGASEVLRESREAEMGRGWGGDT